MAAEAAPEQHSQGKFIVDVVVDPSLTADVAEVAAATFPLACPPHSSPDDIAGFIKANLAEANFADYIAGNESDVLVARTPDGTTVGYSLVHHRPPSDPDVAAVVGEEPSSELSKMYVLPDHHSRGRTDPPAQLLMRAAIKTARDRGSVLVWLGVNQENVRAQRFYVKMGFERAGVKTFDLNGSIENDFILIRRL
ncbi:MULTISPECIES: GNAT family N-acetyltransferase [Gordonia]|uniref:GNAT family N-acetyltransferase n=1 Tax=unclassified Gordonia (in: high G+C Gram-positive bacteria) TaxID=2657482 RepID=UPI003FA53BC3